MAEVDALYLESLDRLPEFVLAGSWASYGLFLASVNRLEESEIYSSERSERGISETSNDLVQEAAGPLHLHRGRGEDSYEKPTSPVARGRRAVSRDLRHDRRARGF